MANESEETPVVAGQPVVSTVLDPTTPEAVVNPAEQTERLYVAEVQTPAGTFKQIIKAKGAGGLLSDNPEEHIAQLEAHLKNDLHPRASSAKVTRLDPNNPEHAALRKAHAIPKHIAAFMGPTATGNASQPRARHPNQLGTPASTKGVVIPK